MDFSNCKNDDFHTYSGKSKKTQIIYNNKSYLVKYRKKKKMEKIFFMTFLSTYLVKYFKILDLKRKMLF